MQATFECRECGEQFRDELPPLLWIEAWPNCCASDAFLIAGEEVGYSPPARADIFLPGNTHDI